MKTTALGAIMLTAVWLLGCAGKDVPILRATSDTSTSSGSTGMEASTTGHEATSHDRDTESDESTTSTTSSTGTTIVNDAGVQVECSIWDQDCPPGEKCTYWANDGGNAWNATRCWPIAPDPAQVGEPCEVEESGVSGIDNCDLGSMCWDVDPDTLTGECVAFCMGTRADPTCADDNKVCSISGNSVLVLCLPVCHPLEQDCARGQGCYAISYHFLCAPDGSGEAGAAGDPCDYVNACDPGLQCRNAEGVPGCAGSWGCCTPHCDVTDPSASQSCPGFDGGQECVAWFEEGAAPPGYENVGICFIPA